MNTRRQCNIHELYIIFWHSAIIIFDYHYDDSVILQVYNNWFRISSAQKYFIFILLCYIKTIRFNWPTADVKYNVQCTNINIILGILYRQNWRLYWDLNEKIRWSKCLNQINNLKYYNNKNSKIWTTCYHRHSSPRIR